MSIVDVHKAQSLQYWYKQAPGALKSLQRRDDSPTWQVPLIGCAQNMERAYREAQIQQAGSIWIRNYDLSKAQLLWIEDVQSGQAWCFERAAQAGQSPVSAGPIELAYQRELPKWIDFRFRYYEGTLEEFAVDGVLKAR